MVAGIPFPDIYDWTWGEIVEHIKCRHEADTNNQRLIANALFRTAFLIPKVMYGQRGAKYRVIDEYDYLWTDEERAEMKRNKIMNSFRVAEEK